MPHVEVLPNSAASVAPGWTYVVDTGYDPSKVAINPKNKKRAAAQPASARAGDNELSARQQTAIARRIAELTRDNDPKLQISIPGTWTAPKTQNVRRIVQYQRQIKHWLDDEDALSGSQQQQAVASRTQRGIIGGQALRRQSVFAAPTSVPATPIEATTPAPAPQTTPSRLDAASEDDALLDIGDMMPPPLDPKEMDALLSAPPLLYSASHVGPPPANGPPQRHFCDNCGYWGSIKCRKCGARVCGLECKDAHEATRCLKWA
ncbi:hypothetical protein ACN47E_001412 [Coniothyrium glycines]